MGAGGTHREAGEAFGAVSRGAVFTLGGADHVLSQGSRPGRGRLQTAWAQE